MRTDEFNQIEVTNDQQIKDVEYGKTQKTEFSEQGDTSLRGSKTKFDNKQLGEKSSETVTQAEAVTTVSASASASGVAAVSTSVVAVASTVAITAISVATGISVALHNYDYKFNSFIVSSNELTYELLIVDKNQKEEDSSYEEHYEHFEEGVEEKEPFTLRVYNSNYDYSHGLWLGYNYNTFTGLKLGETYNIVLSESRYGGETLFKETFTTFESTRFNEFYIPGSANFLNRTFDVTMDFEDNDESYSDFTLVLEDIEYPEEVSISYNLDAVSGKQTVKAEPTENDYLNFYRPYHYRFSYKNKGETVEYSEGQVSFYDTSGAVTSFNDIEINQTVDLNGNEFTVQLDYEDPLENLYSFELELTDVETGEIKYIYLDRTTEEQVVNINTYEIDFDKEYTYAFSYYELDQKVNFETGILNFLDYLGRKSEFNDITFETFATNATIKVSLDYVDTLERFDNFVWHLLGDDGTEIDVNLDATTDEQTISAREYNINLKTEYTYQLFAGYRGVNKLIKENNTPFSFTDSSSNESVYNGIEFVDAAASYSNRSFYVALDYYDVDNLFSDFVLVLYDAETKQQIEIELDKTTDPQLVSANSTVEDVDGSSNYAVDIVSHQVFYQVTYKKNNGGEILETISEPEDLDTPVSFANSDFKAFKTSTVKRGSESSDYTLGMVIDYVDGADEYDTDIYSDWHLVFSSGSRDICEINMTNDDHAWEWHEYFLSPLTQAVSISSILDTTSHVTISANIHDVEADVYSSDIKVYEGDVILKDDNNQVAEIFGVVIDPYVVVGMYDLYIQNIVYSKDYSYYTDCQLRITAQSGNIYTYDFDFEDNYFSISLLSPIEDNYDEDTFYDDLSNPVEIAILYSTYAESPSSGDGGPDSEPEKTQHEPFICYRDFSFQIQV